MKKKAVQESCFDGVGGREGQVAAMKRRYRMLEGWLYRSDDSEIPIGLKGMTAKDVLSCMLALESAIQELTGLKAARMDLSLGSGPQVVLFLPDNERDGKTQAGDPAAAGAADAVSG